MQSVNDDMDELWRKAGNEYPLNTGGADWDKLAARLGLPPEEPKRKDRRYLWLLLLLLVPVVCIRPLPLGMGTASDHESAGPKSATGTGAHNDPQDIPVTTAAPGQGGAPVQTPDAVAGQTTPSRQHDAATGDVPAPNAGASSTTRDSAPDQPGAVLRVDRRNTDGRNAVASATSAAATGTRTQQRPRVRRQTAATNPPMAGSARQASRHSGNAPVPVRSNVAIGDPVPVDSTSLVKSDVPPAEVPVVVPPIVTAPVPTKDSAAIQRPMVPAVSDSVPNTPAPKKQPSQRRSHFYAGIVGGTGFTTIKRQKSPGPGYDIGIAVGYQPNRHLAIEAEVLWSRKQYFSHGKYLKNDLSYLPAYSYVRAVNGDCRMIEIPLTLQYHFAFRKKGNWFAAAGFSSYLMKREEYGYDVKNLMTTYEGHYDTTLRNATRDWMALLQVSAGYRFELRRRYSLRVEPYVQLPVGDAGAGRLPLTSYGLRVALLKSLF
ncbi:porin family protein [Flaviaesturariibacter aridisoli]|uniref:PorT family protein n=1 Tax=Flaviaesturariibacter aridisoli TaxID=2545761 RepID=A0A4R4DYK9_9BACT|nr:porin family protein [Flaviaesturariibacter aridisoli]TCZ70616.1 PorT family protein [Flaviaesturariibacter aridisoli]